MTTHDLKYWYKHFNRRFFKNKLPKVWIHYGCLGHTIGRSYFQYRTWEPLELRISSKLRPGWAETLTITVLLHEMAHISLGGKGGHGPRFRKEIERLFKAGAYTRVRGGVL